MSQNHNDSKHQGAIHKKSKYLADWQKAERYRLASQVGTYDEQDTDVCEFSGQTINKKPIPICEDTKTLEFLGFGFPLFYMFLRFCILLLFLLFTAQGFIQTFMAVDNGLKFCSTYTPAGQSSTQKHQSLLHLNYLEKENNLHEEQQNEESQKKNLYLSQKCNNFFILLARTQARESRYEIVFRISSFLIQVIFLLYMKDQLIKRMEYYDERESDLSDFTVFIKSIPKNTNGIRRKMTQFMQQQFYIINQQDKRYIHEIILVSDVKAIEESRNYFETKLEHYLQHPTQQKLLEVENAQHLKQQLAHDYINQIKNDTISSKEAILIFQTQSKKLQFIDFCNIEKHNNILAKYFGSKQPIVVQEAPQPKQINYENLQYYHKRKRYLLIGWGLSLLFLALITIVFYFIQLLKTNKLVIAIEQLQKNPNSNEAQNNKIIAAIIAWTCLFGIVLFNKFVMGRILHYFTHLQHHDNKAEENFSFAFKYALGMFFTTALMTILVQALKFGNYYTHDFGVIEQETIMFILCSFLIPIIWMIHPWQLCHQLQRKQHYLSSKIPQHEANHLLADYHYDMGKRFAQIIQMMWFTFLYADLIPIGSFLIMIGLILYYWIDKYNLLRRSSIDGNISAQIVFKCMILLDATLFWRFLGEIIFDIQIRDGIKVETVLFLGLAIIYMFVPWNDVLDYFNHEDFKLNDKTYSEQKHRFVYDNYKNHHPIYKQVFKGDARRGEEDFVLVDLFDFAHNGLLNHDKNKDGSQKIGLIEQQRLMKQDIGKALFEGSNGEEKMTKFHQKESLQPANVPNMFEAFLFMKPADQNHE